MIKKTAAVYFSATGTTKTVVELIADRISKLGALEKTTYDFTLPKSREALPEFDSEEIVIFGTPVYAGRVPNILLKYLARLSGNGALAVPLVMFGNRNYDDALIELKGILEERGFKTIAAGAFVGEHSFSRILAAGRPDEDDRAEAEAFAEKIYDKLRTNRIEETVTVKGKQPLRGYYQPRDRKGEPVNILKVKPQVDKDLCNKCGICAELCPMGSIDREDIFTYKGICIKCGACEKKCPQHARYYTDAGYIYHRTELEEGYKRRASNEVFL